MLKRLGKILRGRSGPPAERDLRDRNIMVVTYWSSDSALISRYTMPYVRMIREEVPANRRIVVVTFDSAESHTRDLAEEGIEHIAMRYDRFGAGAVARRAIDLWRLFAFCRRAKIGVLHSWCSTGGALGWVLSVVTGAPLVIDSFEPHADSMVETGTWKPGSVRFRMLLALERTQTRRAAAAIAVTDSMAGYSRQRYGLTPERFYVKPACVDLDVFTPSTEAAEEVSRRRAEGRLTAVYAGKFGGIYLESEAFEQMAVVADEFGPGLEFLILTPTPRAEIVAMAARAGLDPARLRVLFADADDIPGHLAGADFAFNFVNPVPTRRHNTSIKDAEYWACGLPLMIADGISDDSDLVRSAGAGAIVASLDERGYRRAAREMKSLMEVEPATLRQRARHLAVDHRNFDIARRIYRDLYGSSETPENNPPRMG